MEQLKASQIWALPKTDLHLHLDTSLRPDTAIELGRARKVPVKSDDDLIVPDDCGSLLNYLKRIDLALDILQDKESLSRCAQELAEDLINDSVVYAEIRFAPELHTRKGLKEREILETVWNAFGKGQYKNLRTRLIVCALRHMPIENSMRAARIALDNRDLGVIALDLAGDENALPATALKPAFDLAKSEKLNCIIHAGEARGPDSIWEALQILHAQRIGHGVRALEDPKLITFLKEHQIPLETCPTSNVVTGAVKNWQAHPAKLFLESGLKVTINTDARTTVRTTETDELIKTAKALDLNKKQIGQIMINGFESAFDPGPQLNNWIQIIKNNLFT